MATVYQSKVTDVARAETTLAEHMRTLSGIAMLPGGEPILETAEDVDNADIDGQGRYVPKREADNARP